MKLSIFTPTHNPKYLNETYKYLKSQDFDEWIILLNTGALRNLLPIDMLTDSRIKIIEFMSTSTKIGELKKAACSYCTGDILFECDHDDIIVPGAITEVRKAFEKNPNASLVYSNTANFNNDEKRTPAFFGTANMENNYDVVNGWIYRDFWLDGVLYKEAISPEPIPYHASLILWQPNHLRAFNRKHYDFVGGYDENMNVLDDSDLMCRLYSCGEFIHINKCLYLYRVDGNNSWLQRNKEIQNNMCKIQEQYIFNLAMSWSKRNNLSILDLGGRFNSLPGATTVDLKDADINCDLNDIWPFKDSSVGMIKATDIIEHLPNKMHTMSEIHRVLIPGGYVFIEVPSATGPGAFMDPTHVSYWVEQSFWYYTRFDQARYIDNKSIRFKDIVLKTHFPNDWAKYNNIPYVRAYLMCLKDGIRPFGYINI